MIEPNVLAFQNIPLLEAIEDKPAGEWGWMELAAHLGRDKSNTRRTCLALTAEGILMDPPLSGLTDDGRAQLAAHKRAKHGGERAEAQGRWNTSKLQRNPDNRAVRRDHVVDIADTIIGVGDVLQPIVVSPPDADGMRTIWAGEHRWEAVKYLNNLGQLPDVTIAEAGARQNRCAGRRINRSAEHDRGRTRSSDRQRTLPPGTRRSAPRG